MGSGCSGPARLNTRDSDSARPSATRWERRGFRSATALYRVLDRDNPTVHRADLAAAVQSLAMALDRVGRYPEALAADEEAAALYRVLDRDNPTVHRADLARTVRNLAMALTQVGRREEALTRYREAGWLFQEAARSHEDMYKGEDWDTQRRLRDLLRAMGRSTEEITIDLRTTTGVSSNPAGADKAPAHPPRRSSRD